MGSALIEALAYAVWHVAKEGDTVKCWVEKMKDGAAEFTASYRIAQDRGVPYVRDETPDETKAKKSEKSSLRRAIEQILSDGKKDVAVADMLPLVKAVDPAIWDRTDAAWIPHMKTHMWTDLVVENPWRFRYLEDVA